MRTNTFLATNIKYLRGQQKLSQQVLADRLNLSRSNLAKYESGVHEPNIDALIRTSRYFGLTIDILLTVDLTMVDLEELLGQEAMIMPVQVDADGDRVVEIIPHDASAGYLGSYSDPEYIEALEHLYLPFLPKSNNCRAFPVSGDSMPPVIDGSYIVGEYVERLTDIKVGSRYIVVSRDEGIVFKRISELADECLFLSSDNPRYKPFTIPTQDVLEIWEFVASISIEDSAERHAQNALISKINSLQEELARVTKTLEA